MAESFTHEEYLVEAVVAGPNREGRYQVKWNNHEKMTWEPIVHLKDNASFIEYQQHQKKRVKCRVVQSVDKVKVDLAKLVVKSGHHCKVHSRTRNTKFNKNHKKCNRRRHTRKRKF